MARSRPPLTGSNRLVYTVPEAGRLLGLGRNAAYDAARRGDIPTIKLGRLLRVPKAALHKLVGIEPAYSRTVGEADDTADNTDEDSAESDDDEAVVQITLCRGQYRAKILWLGPAPDQQDADHSANCGDPGDVGEDHPASHGKRRSIKTIPSLICVWPKPRRIAACGRGEGFWDFWSTASPTRWSLPRWND